MLSLLLDEQISPVVAEQVILKRPDIAALSIYHWHDGAFVGAADEDILSAAATEGLTLVTYDLKTITPLLGEWAANGVEHGGVIFVDNRTIASNDFGGLVGAIIQLWAKSAGELWRERVVFLEMA